MSVPTAAASYRVVRVSHDGGCSHPIVDRTGRIVTLPEVEVLADLPAGGPRARHLCFVMIDESLPANGDPRRRLGGYRWEPKMPLTLLDLWIPIGVIEEVRRVRPGAIPGTEGEALVAVARLRPSVVGDCTWRAVVAGLFTGVCCVLHAGELQDTTTGDLVEGEIAYVRLGSQDLVCIRGARVLSWWES